MISHADGIAQFGAAKTKKRKTTMSTIQCTFGFAATLRRGFMAFVISIALFPMLAMASIVSEWNKVALVEVRINSRVGPPIIARALAIAHTCIYDAWAAYSPVAIGTVLGGSLRRPVEEHTYANKAEAVSYAAYRCLLNLFPTGEARLGAAMKGFGYDPANMTTDITRPAGVGNVAAQAVIDDRRHDGSNQYGDLAPGAYADYTGYVARNPPLPFCTPLVAHCPPQIVTDPIHWQPLISDTGSTQKFIAPHWNRVRPFALKSVTQFDDMPWLAPPPDIQQNGPFNYQRNVDEALRYSRNLTLQRKILVEYWADGPDSELPPGHWGLFAQFISQRDAHSIGRDARMFFVMHNASFDAGIVAWHLKRKYDGVRPISAVRYLRAGETVLAWGGPGRPTEQIPGEKWTPYNPGSNLTPAFPGYISGHSTFSRASAKALKLFTGSDYFGFSTVIPPNFGRVEPGIPAVPTEIRFHRFSDAARQAGKTRLYGGIHFSDDNMVGQRTGRVIGQQAFAKAQMYFMGITPDPNAESSYEDPEDPVDAD